MISQTVEYALRATVALAFHHDEPRTVQSIADFTRVPAPYLSKLMQGLVRAGVVQSKRGLGGGFTLTKKPADVSIWDVVAAVDPMERIHRCPLGLQGHTSLCPLHRRLDESIAHIEKSFQETTLAELISDAGEIAPLCQADGVSTFQLSSLNDNNDGK
ncbi:MAG: Rrf2 family transcriptional regulator [Planctomycetaceae bacterium]